jgi:hypothetical protein
MPEADFPVVIRSPNLDELVARFKSLDYSRPQLPE